MTDVEPKTSNKRKSFGGKKETPKKPKVENVKTPKKAGTPQQQKSPQKQKAPEQPKSPQKQKAPEQPQQNVQNNAKKFNKKANQKNGSPTKALKPFAGTAALEAPKEKQEKKNKKDQKPAAEKKEDVQGKKKRDPFFSIKQQIRSGDDAAKKEAAKAIEGKLQLIQSRSDLTKTALRKIKMLKRLQRVAEGKEPEAVQQKPTNTKGEASKRRERRKKAEQNAKAEVEAKGKSNAVVAGKKGPVKVEQVAKPNNQKPAKKAAVKAEPESEEDSDDESEEIQNEAEDNSDEEDSGEEESDVEEESDDEEDGDDDDDEDDDDEEEEDDDEESEEDIPPPPKEKKRKTPDAQKPAKTTSEKPKKEQTTGLKAVDLDDLKKNDFIAKNQKRYVVFVGNIPYDTTKQDLLELFHKCGEIKHVRIPTEKKGDRPRGFAYVEAANDETYQKCLSKHHSFLKGRRVNVQYTMSGKKKGDGLKKEIKKKNFKLDSLRKRGVLMGSTKESQRRAFRRKKENMKKNAEAAEES